MEGTPGRSPSPTSTTTSSSTTSAAAAAPRAWDFFEEHVRTIHGSSDMFSKHQGPSFQASSTFQKTMVDLYGYPDYSHPPPARNVSRGLCVAGAASRFLRLRKRTSTVGAAVGPAGGAAGGVRERAAVVVDRRTVENAKRGWRILKQYVQENYASKRTSQAALSWSMLRQTLKGQWVWFCFCFGFWFCLEWGGGV